MDGRASLRPCICDRECAVVMNRFTVVGQIGKGSAGSVTKATVKKTGATVAIKHITNQRFTSFSAALAQREVRALSRIRHPNVLRLLEVVRENEMLYLILEYAEASLYQWMRAAKAPLGEPMVRVLAHRLLLATNHVHKCGFVHRDVKPMNILVSHFDGDPSLLKLKLADFGAARELPRTAPGTARHEPLTPYVSTRWYRAPEVLLHASGYAAAVDMWAVGVIIAEAYRLQPLFPGNTTIDQLDRIAGVLGRPTEGALGGAQAWPYGCELVRRHEQIHSHRFPRCEPIPIAQIVPHANADGLDLIASLLRWDPAQRLTAREALRHPFVSSKLMSSLRLVSLRLRTALLRWALRSRSRTTRIPTATGEPPKHGTSPSPPAALSRAQGEAPGDVRADTPSKSVPAAR